MMFSINLVTCKVLPSALKGHIYACLQAPPPPCSDWKSLERETYMHARFQTMAEKVS